MSSPPASSTKAPAPACCVAPSQQNVITLKSHIDIEFVDEFGNQVSGERFRLFMVDGSVLAGELDCQGRARVWISGQGPCELTFPDLDADSWTVDGEKEES